MTDDEHVQPSNSASEDSEETVWLEDTPSFQ